MYLKSLAYIPFGRLELRFPGRKLISSSSSSAPGTDFVGKLFKIKRRPYNTKRKSLRTEMSSCNTDADMARDPMLDGRGFGSLRLATTTPLSPDLSRQDKNVITLDEKI